MRSIREKAKADGSGKVVSVDLRGISVFIAMPTHRDLPPQTVLSLLNTQTACMRHDVRLRTHIEPGCSVVALARSIVVHNFLMTDADKLFWIDSDMSWEADSFLRMVA